MNPLSGIGRFLIILGSLVILLGLLLLVFEKVPFLGKLPGDILIRRKKFVFYFPLATSLLLSLLLSLLWGIFFRR